MDNEGYIISKSDAHIFMKIFVCWEFRRKIDTPNCQNIDIVILFLFLRQSMANYEHFPVHSSYLRMLSASCILN